jgi:hypothetical protein
MGTEVEHFVAEGYLRSGYSVILIASNEAKA